MGRHPRFVDETSQGGIAARIRDGALEVLVDNEWTRVPPDALVKTAPPDLRTHVYAPKGSWSPRVIFRVVLGQGM